MNMLTIGDIVALAKQGWNYSQVKELIEISKDENITNVSGCPSGDDAAGDNTAGVTPAVPESDNDSDPEPEKEPEPDYKKLYESTKIELDKAQKANTHINVSSNEDEKTDTDIILDLFKEFM